VPRITPTWSLQSLVTRLAVHRPGGQYSAQLGQVAGLVDLLSQLFRHQVIVRVRGVQAHPLGCRQDRHKCLVIDVDEGYRLLDDVGALVAATAAMAWPLYRAFFLARTLS